MAIFGQRNYARTRGLGSARALPQLPMGQTPLETPDPLVTVREGQFGAAPIERNQWRFIGSGLKDIGNSLRGGSSDHLGEFFAEEEAAQQKADWGAQLDGMDLSPEVRTFADANPELFRAQQYQQAQAEAEKQKQLGLLSGLGLPDDVMKRASLDPAGFMAEYGKSAGKAQTDTFFDPLSGGWNTKPIMGQNGDSLFMWDGVSDPTFEQRPKAFDEMEQERAARAEEVLTSRELSIRDRNARTAEKNAGPRGSGPSIIDDPNQPRIPGEPGSEQPIRYQNPDGSGTVEGMMGGRLIRVGIGADGRYAPTDGDPVIPQGKRFPPPSFSTVAGLGDKAGPNINAEQKKMDAIDTMKDSAVNLKGLNDKYATQSEGYPFGAMPWDGVRQWADPRTKGLEGLNAQMALEIGKMAKGAMSDADREWFMKAAPNALGNPKSNATFIMRANELANNANQYASFMKAYRAEYGLGSLAEAQRYWDTYLVANPVFDDNGDAVDDRMTYTEFFTGTPAKRDDVFQRDYPGVRGSKGGGLSAAEQRELDELDRLEREGAL